MKKMKKLLALTTAMTLFASQVQAQGQPDQCCESSCVAYDDCEQSSYMSALIPLGALAIAAVLIATTDRHHHHSSSNNKHHCSSSHFHSHL